MIVVTGANGFLGFHLIAALLEKGFPVLATGKTECRLPYMDNPHFSYRPLDFTDPFAVHDLFEQCKPEIVVHAGAMSKPDECERNQWQCYETNVLGTLQLLANAEVYNCFFLFVSTDFVFNGIEGMYKEDDRHDPVNFYGKSKSDAEDAVKEYPFAWSIVRTALVYGKPATGKPNLLTIVKDKLEKGERYQVVADQLRTPTYIGDLAKGITAIIEKKATGVFHLSGEEVLTPCQMAYITADFLQLDRSLIEKVSSDHFSQSAKRPLRTGFIIDKAKKELGYQPISFEEGLQLTFA